MCIKNPEQCQVYSRSALCKCYLLVLLLLLLELFDSCLNTICNTALCRSEVTVHWAFCEVFSYTAPFNSHSTPWNQFSYYPILQMRKHRHRKLFLHGQGPLSWPRFLPGLGSKGGWQGALAKTAKKTSFVCLQQTGPSTSSMPGTLNGYLMFFHQVNEQC